MARRKQAKPSVPRIKHPVYSAYLGRSLEDAVRLFSPEVVFKLFTIAANEQLSVFCRQLRAKGKSESKIADAASHWTPTIKRRGKSPLEKAARFLASMTEQEKSELAKMLAAEEPDEEPSAGVREAAE